MKFHLIILLAISCIIFLGCDPCRNLDCISSNTDAEFRFISRIDGKDLVFGPAPLYQREKIKFYTVKGSDTTVLPWQQERNNSIADSVLAVDFFTKPDTVYLQLDVADVDTLAIKYQSRGSRCCGTIYEIERLRFNNLIDELPGSYYPNRIFK